MPRPRHGTEVKKQRSIRLEPRVQKEILKKFKRLQDWIDSKASEDFPAPAYPENSTDMKH